MLVHVRLLETSSSAKLRTRLLFDLSSGIFQCRVIEEVCYAGKKRLLKILEIGGFGGLWSRFSYLKVGWPRQPPKTSAVVYLNPPLPSPQAS